MTQQKKTFLIKYTAFDKKGKVLKANGEMKVKNKVSKFEAQCSFEEHLKKKYNDFGRLVIHGCTEDIVSNMFGDIDSNAMDIFNKMFGGL
jgi:hypothetical protein